MEAEKEEKNSQITKERLQIMHLCPRGADLAIGCWRGCEEVGKIRSTKWHIYDAESLETLQTDFYD